MKRILLDANGLKISEPGFDVTTAGDFDLAFSSNFRAPKLITKGSFTVASSGDSSGNHSIAYGATYSPPPYIVAIANCANWTNSVSGGSNFPALNNNWVTPFIEWPSATKNAIYGGGYIVGRVNVGDPVTNRYVPADWASCKFIMQIFADHVLFSVNGAPGGATVKYAILDVV